LKDRTYQQENIHVKLDSIKLAKYPQGEMVVGYKGNEQVMLHGNNLYVKFTNADEIKNAGIADKEGKPGALGWYMKELGQNGLPDRWRKMPHENYALDERTGNFISQKDSTRLMCFADKQFESDIKTSTLNATIRTTINTRTDGRQ